MNKLTNVFALLLVVALASTTFYVGTQLNSVASPLDDEQNVSPIDLEVEFDSLHVSVEGESKLHVNESSIYQAVVSGGSGNFGYLWSVEPVDEKVVFSPSGGSCGFMFVVATIDPYTLSVEVTDLVSGDKAFDSFTVYDPYTLPDLYLESSLADFVCRVKGDGAGWYFVSDGESGKTVFSSTVLFDATNYALTSTTSGNVLLDGVYFDYSLDIPVGISVTESVDGLVRVFVNEADSQGSPYTISVDSVHPTYYLAQDRMCRFIDDFSSSNLTALQDTVLGATTSGEIRLNEVAFDLALMQSIPDNVAVVESVNGLERTFINPLDSQGSPYTLSVSGANYFGTDKQNQICYTSTDAATVINTIGTTDNPTIIITEGTFTANTKITLPENSTLKSESETTIIGTSATNLIDITGDNAKVSGLNLISPTNGLDTINATGSAAFGIRNLELTNLNIVTSNTSTSWGIRLVNPYIYNIDGITIDAMGASGFTEIIACEPYTINWGDGNIGSIWVNIASRNLCYGVSFNGTSAGSINNVDVQSITVTSYYSGANSYLPNAVGMYESHSHRNTYGHVNIEQIGTGLRQYYSGGGTFNELYLNNYGTAIINDGNCSESIWGKLTGASNTSVPLKISSNYGISYTNTTAYLSIIPHGLFKAPEVFHATFVQSTLNGAYTWTADDTNVYVNFNPTAATSATVIIKWDATTYKPTENNFISNMESNNLATEGWTTVTGSPAFITGTNPYTSTARSNTGYYSLNNAGTSVLSSHSLANSYSQMSVRFYMRTVTLPTTENQMIYFPVFGNGTAGGYLGGFYLKATATPGTYTWGAYYWDGTTLTTTDGSNGAIPTTYFIRITVKLVLGEGTGTLTVMNGGTTTVSLTGLTNNNCGSITTGYAGFINADAASTVYFDDYAFAYGSNPIAIS